MGKLFQPTGLELRMLLAIIHRQFGRDFSRFFKDHVNNVQVEHSKKTGRVRYVYLDGELLLVLRPMDGFFSLTLLGAKVLSSIESGNMQNGLMVLDEVAPFIMDGRNLFAKHVVEPVPVIRPSQEVYIIDESRRLLAVGKALLSSRDIVHAKRGIAVKIRHGVGKDKQ